MRDRMSFTDEELAEIGENKPSATRPDALGWARAWVLHVEKIDQGRALPQSDRSVWTEHDFAAALFIRDFVEAALGRLRPALADKVRECFTAADDLFRSFTVADSGDRIATIAGVDLEGRGWWWFRVPASGPIARDLATYSP
ncbi:hypothetical protein VSH64_45175 [Amycolatopsis rhabdoformis]|uniref:Uncharacterized protein n=1 Tax=Amycolatopsis rhabdoformis TaxID=1448059 RepID=A0ABZ1I6C0_9PSEU|nr:hypothetical protein [Amycolatopsis rhabdoformis]WSE29910.1 hypothetical protein VSH64_45175 [Amycolatopsis rhabdoformis]